MKKILISFIQDRSGSMADVWKETLNGFKTYVKDMLADQQKDSEVEYVFSLTTFDTSIDTPYIGVPIANVDGDILQKFGPRGGTALYDAVGKTLQAHDEDKSLTFDKAIVVIVTDGQENSSREWSKDALHAAIDERIKRGNWTFTYLGTQPETWSNASALGVGVGASATYNAHNAAATYATVAVASMNMSRSARGQSHSFFADNTSQLERCAVGMQTEDDASEVPVVTSTTAAPGNLSWGSTAIPSTPPPAQTNSTNRKWK